MLQKIVQKKIESLERDKKLLPLSELKSRLAETTKTRKFHFRKAISGGRPSKPKIIAEIKRGSPSKGFMRPDLNARNFAEIYEKGGASAISVITEKDFFFAREDDFYQVRKATNLPVLRKDFIIDAYQIYQSAFWGADAILLIARILPDSKLEDFIALADELNLDSLVEVHSEEEMERVLKTKATIIGINNRNLATFQVSLETTIKLAKYLDDNRIGVCESGIKSRYHIEKAMMAGIRAFLIGEHFIKAESPLNVLREFSGVDLNDE